MPHKGQLKVIRTEEAADMLRMRRDGHTYRSIATVYKMSVSSVYERVQKALHDTIAESADEVRTLELERLDQMQAAIQTKVDQGDPRAVQSALAIMDRRAKYLGIDQPAKTEVTVALSETDKIDAAVAELVAAMQAHDAHADT